MKIKVVFSLVLTLFLVLGSINIASASEPEIRKVGEFTEIQINIPCKLIIQQTNETSLKLEGPKESIDEITTVVHSGTLKISTENKKSNRLSNVTIYITTPALTHIATAGQVDVLIASKFTQKEFSFESAGKGILTGEQIYVDKMHIETAGHASVEIAGKCETMSVKIAGSGSVKAEKFETKNTNIEIAGSGNINVMVSDNLNTEIAGSGEVKYIGDPKISNTSVGSGKISKLN